MPSFVKCLVNCIPFADCFLTGILSKLICKLNNCYPREGQRKYFLLATLQGVKYQQNVEKQCVQFCKAGGQGIWAFFPIFFIKNRKKTFAFLIYVLKCLILLHFTILGRLKRENGAGLTPGEMVVQQTFAPAE
jgi:hypothetical protein